MAGIHNVLIGADGAKQITINILSGSNNYVLNTAKVSGYVPGSTNVTLVINSGVTIGSASTNLPSLSVDSSWAPGDTISIINNGLIIGKGGAGGKGGTRVGASGGGYNLLPALAGGSGGTALSVSFPVFVTNNGTIGGGGGGGGGGTMHEVDLVYISGGGGGGAGFGAASSNFIANPWARPLSSTGTSPTSGSVSSGGSGGVSAKYDYPADFESGRPAGSVQGGTGGNGGNLGAAGQDGFRGNPWSTRASGSAVPGTGGAGGLAVSGNSNITWVTTGTRLGAIV